MAELQQNGKVCFGPFELEPQAGVLRKNGGVVTREELQQKIWAGTAYGDFDHSLNIAINKIRQALGDSAATPRYVETLPRRGYRFIAPVSTDAGDISAPEVRESAAVEG